MRKHLALFLIWAILLTSLTFVFANKAVAINTTVRVNPTQTTVHVGEYVTVNVTLSNVTNLYGWEIWLYWNRTVLYVTSVVDYVPGVWGNDYQIWGYCPNNNYNATHGRCGPIIFALCPASGFNGSMTLMTLTFRTLTTGSAFIDLDEIIIVDNSSNQIPHAGYDGTVTVLPPPLYMRSDQHTVNNATMNKLMTTHTGNCNVTSASSLDPENEWTCYWGMRAWKRSSSGTETEITSGSPVAVVSRSTSGQGTQSATWNCPATNLTVTDCLVIRVYYKFDITSWTMCVQFSTVQLNATSLLGQTWTVHYYTSRSYNSPQHKTYMYYYWDHTYTSRIENFNHN